MKIQWNGSADARIITSNEIAEAIGIEHETVIATRENRVVEVSKQLADRLLIDGEWTILVEEPPEKEAAPIKRAAKRSRAKDK